MPKPIDTDKAQPPLIPMSAEEMQAAGQKLAEKIRELEDLKKVHTKERTTMKKDRDKLATEVSAIASTIRQHGR